MEKELQERADRIFDEALGQTRAKDPREFYRARLREMKADDPEGYLKAVAYYETDLVPSIAEAGDDPLVAWQRFGCQLAGPTAAGTPGEAGAHRRWRPPRGRVCG